MAGSSYAAGLADALDQTIADLERQVGGVPSVPRGGESQSKRTTGAPPPLAPPPASVPVPAPGVPPQQPGEAARAPAAGAYGGLPSAAPAPAPAPYAPAAAPPPGVIAGNLSTQIRRLEELRRWVREDPTFGQLVDNMIGRQVQAAEKRQRIYTAVFSVISLVVGWLLPALVPVTNLTTLLPR